MSELSEKLVSQILEYRDILTSNEVVENIKDKAQMVFPTKEFVEPSKSDKLKQSHRKWRAKNRY
ncbi:MULTISPECIES: hypothetical protein [Vagococcus]|uniref:Uncharacterized protein n=1 Tax=Vagococcus teuberi TaxID=519472 RepID=A0A1J0A6E5_9ENTE|nr:MULTISPECIES: hypothetical protein [Vagococcus]APB31487.1 hypothetical protein BHY08_06370 [Vagococcus teuberi]RHH68162.1 hypothetical protein DW196_08415 [Vagococcus sp. AM17-17]